MTRLALVLALLVTPLASFAIGPHGGDSTSQSPSVGLISPGFNANSEWMCQHWEFMDNSEVEDPANNENGWTFDHINGGGAAATFALVADSVGGRYRIDLPADDDAGGSFRFDNATGVNGFLLPADGRTIFFETRFASDYWGTVAATGNDFLFGIASHDAGQGISSAGAILATTDNFVGFFANNADLGSIKAAHCGGGNGNFAEVGAMNAADDFGDDITEFHVFSFVLRGTGVAHYYLDGVPIQKDLSFANAIAAADAGDNPLMPIFSVVGTVDDKDLDIDYITVCQTR